MRERITASKLKVGGTYLNERMYMYRRILEIEGNNYVLYKNDLGNVRGCSKSHFARKHPYLALQEDIERIDKEVEEFYEKHPECL